VRRAGGYATISGPSGLPLTTHRALVKDRSGNVECDTFTCGHCQFIVHVKPLADAADCGGLCKVCMRLICGPCTAKGTCTPWEKAFEKIEARDRFLRSAGIS
jgi:hypothetical protein